MKKAHLKISKIIDGKRASLFALFFCFVFSFALAADTTPPATPTITYLPWIITPDNKFNFTWSSSSDTGGSGLAGYYYRITKDSVSGVPLRDWTSAGLNTSVQIIASQLAFARGSTYYFSVKARDGAGNESASAYKSARFIKFPSVGTISPSAGSSVTGMPTTITATYIDPDAYTNLASTSMLISTAAGSYTNCFYADYNPQTNKLYLRNDAGTGFATGSGQVSPGQAAVLENSYVKLNCAQTTVSGSGTTLTVNWNITFKDGFAGSKNMYLYLRDKYGAGAGWSQKGTHTVNLNNAPSLVSFAPNLGTSSQNKTTYILGIYTDPDGSSNIEIAQILLDTTINPQGGVFIMYNRKTDKLYLRDDNNTTWLGGYAPRSANIIQNSFCKLECANSFVINSGSNLGVIAKVTFKDGFAGPKNVYLRVKDLSGADTTLLKKGDYCVFREPLKP